MDILDQFADDVTEINISHKYIVGILDFTRFTKLVKLNCGSNEITSLDNLPNSLIELHCIWNKITSLDNLPNLLIKLSCGGNNISSLDNLPDSLIELDCNNNKISSLDNLPKLLKILDCTNNNISSLDNLPDSLIKLKCCTNDELNTFTAGTILNDTIYIKKNNINKPRYKNLGISANVNLASRNINTSEPSRNGNEFNLPLRFLL